MPKVKKIEINTHCYEILDFGRALAEILVHNYHPFLTKENEEKVRSQLLTEHIVNTESHMYHVINPVQDLIKNIDDYVNLDDYEEEFLI